MKKIKEKERLSQNLHSYETKMQAHVKDITRDVASSIVRGEVMVPVCNVGPLLEYIEHLELTLRQRETNHP